MTASSAMDFLRAYFRGTKGRIYLGAVRNPKSTLNKGHLAHLTTRKSVEVAEFVARYDKPEHECAIYYCTATLKDGSTKREAADCFQFASLFADCDDANHDLARDAVIATLEACECPPTMIVNSGHGLQPLWLLSEPTEDAERIIAARQKLQAITASDAVHDAPRYMRLPGTHNSKNKDWLPVEIVSHHPERRYTLEVLEDWLDTAAAIIPRKKTEKKLGTGADDKPFVLPLSTGTDHKRRAAWARVALDESAGELAGTIAGTGRHNALLAKACRMGTMVARGWIDSQEVRRVLFAASEACGLIKDKGRKHFEDTFADGIRHGMTMPHANLSDDGNPQEVLKSPSPPSAPSKGSNANKGPPANLESKASSGYLMRAVRWFWNNRFALGKLGLIGGLPDRGKGLITAYIIAKTTTGGAWPCNEGQAVQGDVLLFTAEDDIEDTIIPRLVAAGADLARVHIIKMVCNQEGKRMFSLVTDLELLRQKIKEIGNVVLIVIDPMSAYIGVGKMDNYRTTDVRGVLAPLKELAEETMISIIGIMHFNKKADVHNAMLRIADSLAYVAAARHCYVVVDDNENQRRLFIKAKNNLAPDMAALSYTVDTKKVGDDPDTGEKIIAPFVVWGSEHVYVTATEAMQAEEKGTSTERPRDTAKEFLSNLLALGPMPQTEIKEAAEAHMITGATLRRAKDELGIKPKKDGIKGPWIWELPKQHSSPEH